MPTPSSLRPRVIAALMALALGVPGLLYAANIELRGRVYADQTNEHIVYVGQHDNYVTVEGDGTTDLDCWIYDAHGRLVDSDTDTTDFCVLRTPGIGSHRLRIKNYGTVYNDYVVGSR